MNNNSVIKIIDYKAGNAPSVMRAINHIGFKAEFARSADDIKESTHIILPGVGSAKATMESLREMDLIQPLEDAVFNKKTLFLGICVGLQILFERSEEDDAKCLGWLKGSVVKYDSAKVRVPQMGWNKVIFAQSPICQPFEDYFYFVNSYYARTENSSDLLGVSDYNGAFAAAVRRDNIYATQFHIEKSGKAGLKLLSAFLNLKGECRVCLQKG